MNKFNGINPNAIMLMAENRFYNSKSFYDEHKETLKKEIVQPIHKLINELYDDLYAVDEEMCLIPGKMVSRFRRDTRFTKDKTLYRENLWVMFMRNKQQWKYQPCMWFEFWPTGMSWGIGIYDCSPAVMECFRNQLDEHGDEFLKAVNAVKNVGGVESFSSYKIDRSIGKDDKLKIYYNAKTFYMSYKTESLEDLFNGKVLDNLRKWIKGCTPMYKFLLGITEKMYLQS